MKSTLSILLLFILPMYLSAQETDIIEVDVFDYNREAAGYNDKGYNLLQEKKYKEAVSYFEKAIAVDKTNITYFENLGIALKKIGAFQEMLANYKLAIKFFPDEPDLYYYCGDAYNEMKQYDAAIESYTKAIKVANDDDAVEYLYLYYFNRGNVYLKMKKYKTALGDLNRTIALEPYFHGAFNNRGYIKFNLQDKRGACDDWRKALELGNKTVGKYIAKYCK